MTIFLTAIFVLLFVAFLFVVGFVLNLLTFFIADKLGWFTKDLKMSWIERKMADYMRK